MMSFAVTYAVRFSGEYTVTLSRHLRNQDMGRVQGRGWISRIYVEHSYLPFSCLLWFHARVNGRVKYAETYRQTIRKTSYSRRQKKLFTDPPLHHFPISGGTPFYRSVASVHVRNSATHDARGKRLPRGTLGTSATALCWCHRPFPLPYCSVVRSEKVGVAHWNGQRVNGRLLFPFCRFTIRTPLNGRTANDLGNFFDVYCSWMKQWATFVVTDSFVGLAKLVSRACQPVTCSGVCIRKIALHSL